MTVNFALAGPVLAPLVTFGGPTHDPLATIRGPVRDPLVTVTTPVIPAPTIATAEPPVWPPRYPSVLLYPQGV